jgi:hypothetical protein
MALPPEPLDTVLVDAKVVVFGEVVDVTATGPALPHREGKKGEKDLQNKAPWQAISLRVDRVLRGDVVKGATIAVLKPEGAYEVVVGTHGPFLLGSADDAGVAPVLGRYGPDTWRAEVVERAFQAA